MTAERALVGHPPVAHLLRVTRARGGPPCLSAQVAIMGADNLLTSTRPVDHRTPTDQEAPMASKTKQHPQQTRVNEAYASDGITAATDLARAIATDRHRAHPQYAGHWDGWTLARVTARQQGKGGVQAEAGDLVLYQPGANATFYSVRLGVDCLAGRAVRPVKP